MLGTLTFGGVDLSTTCGVYITDASIYNSPEFDYTVLSVPGKNGDLFLSNNRYKNIMVSYPCVIYSNFQTNIAKLRATLLSKLGYIRIADSFSTDYYRMGRYVGGLEVSPAVHGDAGTFTLEFDCKPQRFLVSGDEEITLTRQSGNYFGYFRNPTDFHSLPLVTLTGSGSGNVNIYKAQGSDDYISVIIAISDLDGTITIDSELQDAYNGADNMNDKITLTSGQFFELATGYNNVAVSASLNTDEIKIVPRWWTL